jgi:hypothetical protein
MLPAGFKQRTIRWLRHLHFSLEQRTKRDSGVENCKASEGVSVEASGHGLKCGSRRTLGASSWTAASHSSGHLNFKHSISGHSKCLHKTHLQDDLPFIHHHERGCRVHNRAKPPRSTCNLVSPANPFFSSPGRARGWEPKPLRCLPSPSYPIAPGPLPSILLCCTTLTVLKFILICFGMSENTASRLAVKQVEGSLQCDKVCDAKGPQLL